MIGLRSVIKFQVALIAIIVEDRL